MRIEKGLFDNIVLQRVRNVSSAVISGKADSEGPVVARVTDLQGHAIRGFARKSIGKSQKGQFCACLKGLPAGGPYVVILRVNHEEIIIKNVLVGDVWILAGQSNMEGIALAEPKLKPDKMVRAFYADDKWDVADDPIHVLHKAIDPVHSLLGAAERKYRMRGPGLSFGLAMYEETGIPQGLIACAHGGTSMKQWSPSCKKSKGLSLYGATVRRFEKNGGKVAGVLWYQGCSDANLDDAPFYAARMKKLINGFRRDFKKNNLPFVLVQIGKVFDINKTDPAAWNSIQEQQRLLSDKIKSCVTVPAIDLPMDDQIHIGGAGQLMLGRRLADAMLGLTKMVNGRKRPIKFDGFSLVKDKYERGWNIEVSFKNVVGHLQAAGVPSGFSMSNNDGEEIKGIYNIETQKNKVILYTSLTDITFGILNCRLHYGYGFTPYCNITDSAGRSLPVFGPVRLTPKIAGTPFVMAYLESGMIPFDGKAGDIPYPNFTDNSYCWKTHHYDGVFFVSRRSELQDAQGCTCYFVVDMSCDEDMHGELLVGYDGPVKVWLDKKVVIQDALGTNPCFPDKAGAEVILRKGKKYRVVIALSSNNGRAWGISFRFVRSDVHKAKLEKGDYRLPVFIMPSSFSCL